VSSTGSKFIGMVLTLGLTGMAIGFLIAMMEEAHGMHDPTPVFGMVAGAAVFAVLLRGPVGKAIGKMLDGGDTIDAHLAQRVEQLEAQVFDSVPDQQRIAELEERVDFAERMLAQRQNAGTFPAPEQR
jgi:hypothetical protein